MSTVVVFGAGRVGLVHAVSLAELGHDVRCVEPDPAALRALREGRPPYFEPGLEAALVGVLPRLRFLSGLSAETARDVDLYVIAVETVAAAEGDLDLTPVLDAGASIARCLAPGRRAVVALRSPAPVGTCARVQKLLDAPGGGRVEVASLPSFEREGASVSDSRSPERIVLGVRESWVARSLRLVYFGLGLEEGRFVVCDLASAELARLAVSALDAARGAAMVELARVCDAVGADIEQVRRGVESARGGGTASSGAGHGGSIPFADLRALGALGAQLAVDLPLLAAASSGEDRHRTYLLGQILSLLGVSVVGRRVALLGLASGTPSEDVRGPTAAWLARQLHALGATVVVHDPVAAARIRSARLDVVVEEVRSANEAIQGAHLALLLTVAAEYRSMSLSLVRERMAEPRVYDLCGLWFERRPFESGISYRAPGRRALSLPDLPLGTRAA